jgi:hypothetical protein
MGATLGANPKAELDLFNFIIPLSGNVESSSGTIFRLPFRPEASSKRLVSKQDLTDDRRQAPGLIQPIPAKEQQRKAHFVAAASGNT